MRRQILAFAMLLTCTSAACAQSLQFDMTGEIVQGTCDWSVGDSDKKVLLDPTSVTVFPATGAVGYKSFSLTLQNCTPGLRGATFVFSGTSDANDALRFANAGTAGGVAVQLESADGSTIAADGSSSSRTVPVVSGTATIDLRAAYWRIAARPLTVLPCSVSSPSSV